MADRLRIILLGYLVRGPMGGFAWADLHYLLGLVSLGHDVYFVEDSGDSPWCCYDPARGVTDADPTYGLEFATRTFDRAGLRDRWAYYDAHTDRWQGPCAANIREFCASADLVLNVGGANPLRPWLESIPARAYIDMDPAFTQIQHLIDPAARQLAIQHTCFFTFGENIPAGTSTAPSDGLAWQRTRHPIFLDAWPVTASRPNAKFTTVMLWDSYPALEYGGRRYGMKSESFGPYLDLPQQCGPALELAVSSPSAPLPLLAAKGWSLSRPLRVARDPWAYQRYIQRSKAEFTVAKHGYVVSHCGWFSERTAAYLASGRPVVTQETGFSNWLPTGHGVVAFTTPDEAVAAIEDVSARYEHHARAARALAEEYFDARKILSPLIESALAATTCSATEPAELLRLPKQIDR